MNIEERVFSYIEKYNMIEAGSQVIVGISGGADSVCLLFLLKKYQERKPFSLYGVHVNHGIRGAEADRDEEYARTFCTSLEIPFTCAFYDVPKLAREEKKSLEEAGRLARRRAFLEKAKEWNSEDCRAIALAHHENDNAETVLHNLIRGSRLTGLGGIRPCQVAEEGILYIRPLLDISKAEIEGYLRENRIPWVTDSSNEEVAYTRNKIRHKILPKMEEINPKAVVHIAKTAENLLEIEEYLTEQAERLYRIHVTACADGYWIAKELFSERRLMQSYVIRKVLEQATGEKKDLTAVHVESVLDLAKGRTGASLSLMGGLRVRQEYGRLFIGFPRKKDFMLPELEFQVFPWENQQIPEKRYTKWFDYDKIKSSLEIRYRKPGDFLTVTADGGRKKLKDYFIDCKIPREERDVIPILTEGNHVLWVIGQRISQYYKVTNQTKTVLKVHVKGVNENE